MPLHSFSTAIGCCGIAWEGDLIAGFLLPGDTYAGRPESSAHASTPFVPADTARSIPTGASASAHALDSSGASETASIPSFIAALVERVQAHLGGRLDHLKDLPLDWERVTPFQARVLRATVEIPPGQALTYGELAARLGKAPGTARAIGGALGANPWPLLVPCHRVTGAGGRLTGFSSRGGIEMKARLLAIEGYAWA